MVTGFSNQSLGLSRLRLSGNMRLKGTFRVELTPHPSGL